MDVFEYLPQLIVAYDGNDEFANLIHVKKADRNVDYFCPCCGGTVKPRALESTKEQSHYYHLTGKCTKESQLHFFCKNWLFEKGSKFYIDDDLFEVDFIEVEKTWISPFGDYKPDITVYTTSGKIIYFEIFFSNRKTGDDYFCKWDFLGNSVVEVNIREYMIKTDTDTVPTFTYLYHDGVCYSKPYVKKDLYANTIAKIKKELSRQKVLNYKARIEKLDWFWQEVQKNKSKEDILHTISSMEYDDMVSCYEIVKRKNCVSYLKNDMLNIINKSVMKKVRDSIDVPFDKNVYFDLKQRHRRTYEVGIRLNIELEHITFNDFLYHILDDWHFDKINGYPKITFKRNTFSIDEIDMSQKEISKLRNIFDDTIKYKEKLIEYDKELSRFEKKGYKVRCINNNYTVLKKNDNSEYDLILDKYFINSLDIEELQTAIDYKNTEIKEKIFWNTIYEDKDFNQLLNELKNYNGIKSNVTVGYERYNIKSKNGLYVSLWLYGHRILSQKILPNKNDLINTVCQYKSKIISFVTKYKFVYDIIYKINSCKNKLWKAEFYIDYTKEKNLRITIMADECNTHYDINLEDVDINNNEQIIKNVTLAMKQLLQEIEQWGYRVMWIDGGEG